MLLWWLVLVRILPDAVSKDALRTLCTAYATSSCLADEARAAAADGAYYWSQQKGGPARTGYSPFTVTADLRQGPTWQWREPHNDTIRTSPLIDDKSNIYLTTIGGRIYKLSQDGQLLWRYRSSDESLSGVSALLDGKLFVSTRSGHVFSVDMESGSEVWRVRISGGTSGDGTSMLALNKTIVLATHLPHPVIPDLLNHGNSKVIALSTEDGSVKWTFNPDTYVSNLQASSPGDGSVIFQDKSGGLYRVGIDDGHLIWRSGVVNREWTSTAASVVDSGQVFSMSNFKVRYAGFDLGLLSNHRLSDGRLLYSQVLFTAANQAPAVGKLSEGGKPSLIAQMGDNEPLAVVLQYMMTGWPSFVAIPMHIFSMLMPAMITPSNWFNRLLNVTIAAFDAEVLEVQWRHEMGFAPHEAGPDSATAACAHAPCSQPVIGGDGTVYVACGLGKVYAIRDANSDGHIDPVTEISSYDFGDGWQGSLAIAPGLLAVASCGGGLHVFKS